jgi:hypothetical protein
VHFGSDATSDPRCSLEYPAEPRRDALRGDVIVFCKEFDLGVSET